jgi:hypothetical protein
MAESKDIGAHICVNDLVYVACVMRQDVVNNDGPMSSKHLDVECRHL